jgi:transcriptional regulator
MYIRAVHAELDVPTLQAFIHQNPLGILTTAIPYPDLSTIQSSHIPWVLDRTENGSPGRLRGHIARANPQTKALIHAVSADSSSTTGTGTLKEEVLILFQAPVHAYVTPQFYTTTKPDTGKVVPTWNYAAVQVYGTATIYHSGPAASEYLQSQIEALTEQQERLAGHEEGKAWKVDDAPDKYMDVMKKAIVGIEVEIKRIEGRFKLSQESNDGDWKGVVDGFRALGTREGEVMAGMVEERGKERAENVRAKI